MKTSLSLITILLSIFFINSSIYSRSYYKSIYKGEIDWDQGILVLGSNGGDFFMRFDARVFLDGAYYSTDDLGSGTELRRGRLALKFKVWEDWNIEWDIDVADNEVAVKDMWIQYNVLNTLFMKMGHFKVPFSMEELTSSLLINFMERSLPNSFAPGRKMGLGFYLKRKNWQFGTAIYGQEVDAPKDDNSKDEGWGVAVRASYAPILSGRKLLHLGGGFLYQTPDNESESYRVKSYPESKVSRVRYLDTGNIEGVNSWYSLNGELAASFDSLYFQGEYTLTKVDQKDKNLSFDGWFLMLGWFVTGEHRVYDGKEGEFGKVLPKDIWGAVEIAIRYSHINLNSDPFLNGEANQYTAAINWYINPNIKFMLNYSYIDHSPKAVPEGMDEDFHIFQIRIMAGL